jgi:hypothetical protein
VRVLIATPPYVITGRGEKVSRHIIHAQPPAFACGPVSERERGGEGGVRAGPVPILGLHAHVWALR